MPSDKGLVHLGYEVGSGEPVHIPVRHMVVTGQSQEAGKTTALEALISRSRHRAVAFVTKRGERAFMKSHFIPPYFKERADWQFVASVLEAAMRERLKFERAWIIRASKGARTLADVQRNVRKAMESAKGLSADVYLTLDSYLDIVVPRVARVHFSDRVILEPGLNAINLSDREQFPPELQSLVMRSVLEWIYEHETETVTIIPEAWEFLPQGRGSPVKLSAIELIRKGAGLKNYVWLDSQDIGGIEKEMLRSCPVWLLGVQRETNEIKRVLENIPAGVAHPKASDIATLEKGQFYACYGKTVVKTYVMPLWMDERQAQGIATGERSIEHIIEPAPERSAEPKEERMSKAVESKLDTLIGLMTKQAGGTAPVEEITDYSKTPISETAPTGDLTGPVFERVYRQIRDRMMAEAPKLIRVLITSHEIAIEEVRETISVDGKTTLGGIAKLLREGFFDSGAVGNKVFQELKRRGYSLATARVYENCNKLTTMGFLTNEGEAGYKIVDGAKSRVK
jgi:hypothetical protein